VTQPAYSGDWDMVSLNGDEGVLRTHGPTRCAGEVCCIHNPTDHHMRSWPMHWRGDRGLMERICQHGCGHPDPDHLTHVEVTRGPLVAESESVHGCCGCCWPPVGGDDA